MTTPTNTFDIANEKRRQVTGAWIVYFTSTVDNEPVTESIHADELDARRAAMDMPIPARVIFVPWDTTILTALEQDRLNGKTRKVVVLDTPLDIPEEPLPAKARPAKATKTGIEANE